MGEYEPNDSRNVTGQASTQDGRWTGQAANDPTRQDQQQAQQGQAGQQGGAQSGGQQQQGGQSVGQQDDGVSGASNQGNDHTSAIGQNQGGQNQASQNQGGQGSAGSGQPQQFQDTTGQQGGGSGAGRFADQISKHQEVVDSQGQHLGTVDHVDGDRIKLTKTDSPDGEHHYVSLSQVEGIEGGRIRLSGSGDRAR
jgi:hypothetical protein